MSLSTSTLYETQIKWEKSITSLGAESDKLAWSTFGDKFAVEITSKNYYLRVHPT